MVDSLWILLSVGTALGFLSGLGIGGGSLLLLCLGWAAGMEPETARLVNLLCFVPCALISSWLRRRELAHRRLLGTAIFWAVLGAALGSVLQQRLETRLLRKLMGGLFLVVGLRELRYRER